jgi:NADH-quinone oxidoreductase subunit J
VRTALAAVAVTLACAFAFAGRADAQPAGSAAGSAAGSGAAPIRIDLQPGQKVDVPVRPGTGQPGGPGGPPVVLRQPGQPGGAPVVIRPGQPAPGAPGAPGAGSAAPYQPHNHGDVTTGTAKQKPLLAIAFWVFALITVGGAVFVITRRNLIAAVMGMVGTFFGVAATYMMLYASFLAVVQMLVYAGAIMVLFVFVIMILNRPEDEPFAGPIGKFGKGIAGLGLAYLGFRLVSLVWGVTPIKTAGPAPAPIEDRIGASKDIVTYNWGSTKAVGNELFTDYVFPFEAVSILLLVAVVGAIAIARPMKDDEGEPPPPAEEGHA